MKKLYWLLNEDGQIYPSLHPGAIAGHRRRKLYGRLDCRTALRAISRGGYVSGRVFFADEAAAKAAGYRPCAACMPMEYRQWKIGFGLSLEANQRSRAKETLGQVPTLNSWEEVGLLGRDNHQLSRVRKAIHDSSQAIVRRQVDFADAAEVGIDQSVSRYVAAGMAPATRRAYRADLNHFRAWGGEIPSTETELAAYIAGFATVLKPATLGRRIAAISVAHEAAGLENPARSALVGATMRGIRREHGAGQRQAKPLLRDDLFAVLGAMGSSTKDHRDRALLLIGFAGGFRRSELVALDFEDFERVLQGIIITLRRSKTDQDGTGRKIGIPVGRSRWCPVDAVERWFEVTDTHGGPAFRPIDRHGRVGTARLSAEAVCSVVRARLARAGYDPNGFSGHSLRSGFATSAAQLGVSSWRIRQQTGHASEAMLARYIRSGELFRENAAGALL